MVYWYCTSKKTSRTDADGHSAAQAKASQQSATFPSKDYVKCLAQTRLGVSYNSYNVWACTLTNCFEPTVLNLKE